MQFVVPDGYRGVFSVTYDKANGVAVPVTNGQFIVPIPQSGKLLISSWDCIAGRHIISARYVSGELLPPGHDHSAVALRLVTYDPDTTTIVQLIGTEKEKDEAREKY